MIANRPDHGDKDEEHVADFLLQKDSAARESPSIGHISRARFAKMHD